MNHNSEITILVTGVGALIGQGIIRSLRQSKFNVRVIGIDLNFNAMAAKCCDVFICKPNASEASPEYLTFWKKLLVKENIDLVFPGIEIDLFFLNQNRELLQNSSHVQLVLNRDELIELFKDKWRTHIALQEADIRAIPTLNDADWQECQETLGAPPYLLKPCNGNGSRGIVKIDEPTDLVYWRSKSRSPFILQQIIGSENEEYTAAAFGLGDGQSLDPIIFRRKLSPAGNTQYAEVVDDVSIYHFIKQLSEEFRPLGPTNYQFRKKRDKPYLLEINPRISSSSSLRTGFGYNEVEMSIEYYLNDVIPKNKKIVQGKAWRYSEDYFLL